MEYPVMAGPQLCSYKIRFPSLVSHLLFVQRPETLSSLNLKVCVYADQRALRLICITFIDNRHGHFLVDAHRHRWQGPPPWSIGLYHLEADPLRPENRRRPV